MRKTLIVLSFPLAIGAAAACRSTPEAETPEERASDQQNLVQRSSETVMRMRGGSEYSKLEMYLRNARGVMVFPKVHKGGFFVGGEAGSGVLLARQADGWSDPAFYNIGGGSAGIQFGYEQSSVVLVFMTDSAVRSALNGGMKLGADASVAAGTIGKAGAGAEGTVGADIVTFVDVGGVFAGVSLSGAGISVDKDDNRDYYGEGATPRAIVMEDRYAAPGAEALKQALSPVPRAEPRAAL